MSSRSQAVRAQQQIQVGLAYAAFVLIGVSAAVGGVLLPAQIRDYGIDKATIGLTFFTSSIGFVLAGTTAGLLIQRLGTRFALVVGGGACLVAALGTGVRPPFVTLLLLQAVAGYGTGVLESVLNAYLTELPDPSGPLNRLHAFFGVGALIGPSLAAWMLRDQPWTAVWLVVAALEVPLLIGFLVAFPRFTPPDTTATDRATRSGLLGAALRQPAVLLGAVFLSVYVGLEMSVGSWAFTYLIEARALPELLAGYAVTGYWLGLTVGRFLINPAANRIGLGAVGLTHACLAAVAAASLLIWVAPTPVAAVAGFALIGFFLGPIFPTTMVVVPRLAVAHLVPTAVGIMVGLSVVGGAILPWLAGVMAQRVGVWTLLPYAAALTLALVALWWQIAQRLRVTTPPAHDHLR